MRQSFRPRVEVLEDRYTPAGTVTGSFSLGTWTLIGDSAANDITINPTATPNKFVLIGNSTTVADDINPSGVKNIVIKFFAGDDEVTFNNMATRAVLAGSLTINGGKDANDVFINNATIRKNVAVVNGTNTSGADDFEVGDSIIKGKVFIRNGDGNTNTVFRRNSAGVSSIGSLTVVNGAGEDGDSLFDTSVAGSVVFRNGLPGAGNQAGYLEIYNSNNTAGRSVIGGNLKVSFKAGLIDIGVTAITDIEVRGNVIFDCGTSTAEIPFDGQNVIQPALIRGNLTVNGTGPLSVTVGFYDEGTGLIVGKNLTITTGAAANTLRLYHLRVNGATRISTGGGIDTVLIDDSLFFGPLPSALIPFAFRLFTGGGADEVYIENDAQPSTTQFGRTALISMGAGGDTLSLGATATPTQLVELFDRVRFDGGADDDHLNRFNVVSIFNRAIDVAFETILP